jgi:hypothetical protein
MENPSFFLISERGQEVKHCPQGKISQLLYAGTKHKKGNGSCCTRKHENRSEFAI